MKAIKLMMIGLLAIGSFSFAEEALSPPTLPELPKQEMARDNVYGTFGINAGIIPTFNTSVGYQGDRFGVDLQSNLFLIFPIDISSHVKIGSYTKKGNYYGGFGPFYSLAMGFGGELIGGYRSTPKEGLGWFAEGFARPLFTGTPLRGEDVENLPLAATYLGAGYGGIRAGIAF